MNNQFNSPNLTYNENRTALQQIFSHPITLITGIFILASAGYSLYDRICTGIANSTASIGSLAGIIVPLIAVFAYFSLFFNAKKPTFAPKGALGSLKTYAVFNIIGASLLTLISIILSFIIIPALLTLHSNVTEFTNQLNMYAEELPEYKSYITSISDFIVKNADSMVIVGIVGMILLIIYSLCSLFWGCSMVSFSNAIAKTYTGIYTYKVSKLNLIVTIINTLINISFIGMMYWFLHLVFPTDTGLVLESVGTLSIPLLLSMGYQICNTILISIYNSKIDKAVPGSASGANTTYGSFNNTDTYNTPSADMNNPYPTYGTANNTPSSTPTYGTPTLNTPSAPANATNNPYPTYNTTNNNPPSSTYPTQNAGNTPSAVPPVAPIPVATPTTTYPTSNASAGSPTTTQGFINPDPTPSAPVAPSAPAQPTQAPSADNHFAPTDGFAPTESAPLSEVLCPNCGKPNPSFNLFCKECGTKLN